MIPGPSDSLGSILLRYNLISEQQLQEALETQRRTRARLGEVLVRLGYLKEDVLTWCLANQLNIPCVSTIDTRPDHLDLKALDRITPELAHRHHIIPLLLSGDELTVVTDDPFDRDGLQEVERATGLHLNIAAGPPSEIMNALEALYGPEPESDFECEPEAVFDTGLHATATDLLSDWIEHARASGFLRFILEANGAGGQMRVRERGRTGEAQAIDPELFTALIAGLKEACGVTRIAAPVLRPFSVGEHVGTVALGQARSGPVAVVSLEDTGGPLQWPDGWSEALKARLQGPGLWVLGVSASRLWRPVTQSIVKALEPERRVIVPDEEWLSEESAGAFTPEMLEGFLGLEPDLLLLPAFARPVVIEHLRAGLPETTLVLQVAARTPVRALQILRSSGLSGPETAELVRGVVCVSAVEQVCSVCRARDVQGETVRMRMVVGGAPMAASEAPVDCEACHGVGTRGELPVVAWCETSPEFEAGLAEERPLSSVKQLMSPGPLPSPRAQVLRYLEEGLIPARVAEASVGMWSS